jgi:hypothetical protein
MQSYQQLEEISRASFYALCSQRNNNRRTLFRSLTTPVGHYLIVLPSSDLISPKITSHFSFQRWHKLTIK